MKTFRINYRNPANGQEFTEDLDFPGETVARAKLKEIGLEVKDIYAVQREKTFVDKAKEYFFRNFSTRTYDVETELSFLRAFVTALNDGATEKQALTEAKSQFMPKTHKNVRAIIDEMIETNEGAGISDLYDLFKAHEEMFSKDFLTLIKNSRGAKITINKIISNPVDRNKKGVEMEGYVELTESVHELKSSILAAVLKPFLYSAGLVAAALGIVSYGVPLLFKGLKKFNPRVEEMDFEFVGNGTLAASKFVSSYGIYVVLILAVAVSVAVFLYRSNREMRRSMEAALLKTPIVGDILTVFYTKKLTSVFAIFMESGMFPDKALAAVIPMAPFIPMKEELSIFKDNIADIPFSAIFRKYPEEERYMTEKFYTAYSLYGDKWMFGRAAASVLKNADDIWENGLKKIPKKVGNWFTFGGLVLSSFFISGIMMIISFSTSGAA